MFKSLAFEFPPNGAAHEPAMPGDVNSRVVIHLCRGMLADIGSFDTKQFLSPRLTSLPGPTILISLKVQRPEIVILRFRFWTLHSEF
jgi:hypothetical protein